MSLSSSFNKKVAGISLGPPLDKRVEGWVNRQLKRAAGVTTAQDLQALLETLEAEGHWKSSVLQALQTTIADKMPTVRTRHLRELPIHTLQELAKPLLGT